MKFYKTCIIFLTLMVFSVGCVCAEDANSADLSVDDSSTILTQNTNSYVDLNDAVTNTQNAYLTEDYTFNKDNDGNLTEIKIDLAGGTFNLEGNGHVIDANNQAGVFRFLNGEVSINNLVIKNSNKSALIFYDCKLTTNNVTFESNFDVDEGAGIYSTGSTYYSNGDRFIDNVAKSGSAISMADSKLVIDNSTFISTNPVHWSLIYCSSTNVTVLNTAFENLSSRYATVLFSEKGNVSIYNSKFRNLFANATSGAIGVKTSNLLIQDCEFVNVSSSKNGGAVYVDMNGDGGFDSGVSDSSHLLTLINETTFINCSSNFGGAVLQLGGVLDIIGSDLINNHASYCGGAVYISNNTFRTSNSIFEGNYIENDYEGVCCGGALYLDYSKGIGIEHCNFTKNSAVEGGAVYIFDSYYEITYSGFSANGEAIHVYFPAEGSFNQACEFGDDELILDDEYYPSVVDFKGKEIVLNPLPVTGSVDDDYFNLADFNAITPVKNQGSNGACWAFGANGAFESAFLKATGISLDLAENNIQSAGIRYSYYGRPSIVEAGYLYSGLSYYLAWLGAVSTEDDTYDELGKISNIIFTPDSYHVLDVVYVNLSDIDEVKSALIDYGALTIFVTGASKNSPYFNMQTNALYCDNQSQLNHFVTLVGWNDTFSRDNFILDPGSDGAWICKNSWGTEWGDKGFYYLSYYDAPLRYANTGIAYDVDNTVVYNKLYQYDVSGMYSFVDLPGDSASYYNIYEAISNDLIAAVGTYFLDAGIPYTVKVYVNGSLAYSQDGISTYGGYHTIKLDKYVSVGEGDEFTVEIELDRVSIPICSDTRMFFRENTSFIRVGSYVEDQSSHRVVTCLKAYTVEDLNMTSDVVRYYDSGRVEIPSALEGALITVFKDSKEIAAASVSGGKAVIKSKMDPGKYLIVTSYNDTEIINSLEVLISFSFLSEKNIIMDYNAGVSTKAKVLDNLGNVAIGKYVTFKINGKSFKVKTNSKGLATFKIPYTVTPGVHLLTAVCNGYTITKLVKVKQVLRSTSTVKAKKSAKQFTLKATLKSSDGKAIKNKAVKFKLNGKTYTRKTDSKGVAKLVLKKASLSKLKVGKSYNVQITYLKDTIKTTLKVIR